ncbi:MAG: glycoside hydrolase family 25 protein [Lachnospiraceae bacterium]|nr:glycoside hydrolase family 25 protein [Lachnospiraceae bacterium]
MKLPGEDEPVGTGLPVVYMVVGVSAFVLLLLFAVLKSNDGKNRGSDYLKEMQQKEEMAAAESEAQLTEEPEKKLRAEDLDFWDMYPVEEEAETETGNFREETAKPERSTYAEKAKRVEEEEKERQELSKKEEQEQAKNDPATDGRHTQVTNRDGTEEWVMLNPYLKKNTYDFTNLEEKAGLRRYMENGKKISYVGVDLSKQNGDVNFNSMKAAGVDYVMIRLGGRGYSTGQISLDENFKKNIEGAAAAGLDIGVYFYSQAISQEEALQEVNFVIQNLESYRASVKYPIAFDMEFVANDTARIDSLTKDEKTNIATSFLESVKAAGYVPMLYGDKEWLLKEIDLARLQSYDVWLVQEQELPDYPYQFTMWQYSTEGVVNGVTGDANLNISFVGYSQR